MLLRKVILCCAGIVTCFVCIVFAHSVKDSNLHIVNANAFSDEDDVTVIVFMRDESYEMAMEKFAEKYPAEHELYFRVKDSEDVEFLTSEEEELLDAAICHKRDVCRQMYTIQNDAFLESYEGEMECIFKSSYAPMTIICTKYYVVKEIERDARVTSVEVYSEEEAEQAGLALANTLTRANYVRDTCGNRGAGVRVGMVEASGVPDTSDSYLVGATIYKQTGTEPVDSHATKVARILVGTSANTADDGFAPDAILYCCYTPNASSLYSGIEWLVTCDVNIINASLEFPSVKGYYGSISKWIDHLAVQHDVHFVTVSGNEPNETSGDWLVTQPGMAYNAITVGAYDPGDATQWNQVSQFSIAGFSRYKELAVSSRAEKPNIVADGVGFWSSGNSGKGTSFAAPQVAGTIAQLCSYNSAYKTKQTLIGAVLMASAAHKVESTGTGLAGSAFPQNERIDGEPQISNREGAGILDSRWARDVAVSGKCWSVTVYDENFPYEKNVYIASGLTRTVRVCIFWLRQNEVSLPHATGTVTTGTLSNLDLKVYDPNGTLVDSSTTVKGNFEIVQFTPSAGGSYKIQICDMGGHPGKDYIGIAVWEGTSGY